MSYQNLEKQIIIDYSKFYENYGTIFKTELNYVHFHINLISIINCSPLCLQTKHVQYTVP